MNNDNNTTVQRNAKYKFDTSYCISTLSLVKSASSMGVVAGNEDRPLASVG